MPRTIRMMITITATTANIPTQTPALKMPPTTVQPEKNNAVKKNKASVLNFFMMFIF